MDAIRRRVDRIVRRPASVALLLLAASCAPMWNPTPPGGERQTVGQAVPLTDGPGTMRAARFSSDGRWILFQSLTPARAGTLSTERIELAQLRPAANGRPPGLLTPIPITPDQLSAGTGCFSSDGNSLYFACADSDGKFAGGTPAMRLFRADGWQGAVAALAPGQWIDLAQHPITSGDVFSGQPTLSPNGQWVFFVRIQNLKSRIVVARSDGSGERTLISDGDRDGWPRISPDGKRLLFQRCVAGKFQLMLADLVLDSADQPTGVKHVRQLTRHGGFNPCWEPDGRRVIFSAVAGDGDRELFIIRADGSRLTRLTFTRGVDDFPAISPDGRWLVWTSARGGDGPPHLYIGAFRPPEGS